MAFENRNMCQACASQAALQQSRSKTVFAALPVQCSHHTFLWGRGGGSVDTFF